MHKRTLVRSFEILRWVLVVLGFQLAFLFGGSPTEQFSTLTVWVVGSLAGLTGLESLFLGRVAAEVTGYAPSAYQRQSGMNNVALGVTALVVYFLRWGTHAEAAVMAVLLIFLLLSAGNHAYSALREGNRGLKNLLRPAMTLLLVVFVLPMMTAALRYVTP